MVAASTRSPRRRLWNTWKMMLRRCYDPKHHRFDRYGARGIAVCTEWRKSFDAFFQWAINNGWVPGLQIDRRKNDAGYSPGNCRFVTRSQNQANRGKSRRRAGSQFKGVIRNFRGGKWRARIYHEGQEYLLGTFDTEQDAARAYDRAALDHFGDSACLNFPIELAGA